MGRSNAAQARFELLIILHFLLNETDSQNIPKQNDIVSYAWKHFRHRLQRQRITEIFENLKTFQSKYQDLLTFKLGEKNTGDKKKYFVEQRYLTDEEIVLVMKAIQGSRYASKEDTENLINRFLFFMTSKHFREEIKAYAKKFNVEVPKHSKETLEKIQVFEHAIKLKYHVSFKYIREEQRLMNAADIPMPKSLLLYQPKDSYEGYVHSIVDVGGDPSVFVLILPSREIKRFRIAGISEIKTYSFYQNTKKNSSADDLYIREYRQHIKDYLKEAGLPPSPLGETEKISFHFYFNEQDLSFIQASFKSYFKKPLDYKKISLAENKSQAKTPQNIITMIKVEQELEILRFIQWVSKFEIGSIIHVTGPHKVVKILLNYYQKILSKTEKYKQ